MNATTYIINMGLLTSLLLTVSLMSHADISPFTAHYKANIKGFAVKATRELKAVDDQQLALRFSAQSWAAKIDESSVFSYENTQIKPISYLYKQSAFGKKRHYSSLFDYAAQSISSSNKDTISTVPFPKQQVLDKLSYQLQLQLDLLHGKSEFLYTIVDKGNLKEYHFKVIGEEILNTPLGDLNTIKVMRKSHHKTAYIWFAKDWNYLLVQLKQYEDDKQKLSIQLTHATVNQTDVSGL